MQNTATMQAETKIMHPNVLVEKITSYNADTNTEILNKAYQYAMHAHRKQKRASGAPYFSHPLAVADILTEFKLDDATIAAALLHDVIEDTDATLAEIKKIFGKDIAKLVKGLTKIRRLDLVSKEAAQAENLRKLLLSMSDDIRILMIKLADRLHNMRTLTHMRPDKRARIAQETIDIYAPLAARMGMQNIQEELESIAFKEINPSAVRAITSQLRTFHDKSGNTLEDIERELVRELKKGGITAKVYGREKKPFSIWRKMEHKHIALSQLSDIFGFRVITQNVTQCYQALGIVHQRWRAVPGRFKDYISNPKQNDYASIHTTVIGPKLQRVELQIRTEDMHAVAELGVAAHAHYKASTNKHNANRRSTNAKKQNISDSNAWKWLHQMVERISEGETPSEFLEHTKMELFGHQIFCFTPKGDLISLPKGAIPIDFAYAVHTRIGDSCVGCTINGNPAPLIFELNTGDEVEILRSENQSQPPSAWESLAVTPKARAAIRRATRLAIQNQYSELGKEMLITKLKNCGAHYDPKKLSDAQPRLGLENTSPEDVLADIGRGLIKVNDIITALNIKPQPQSPHEKYQEAKRKRNRLYAWSERILSARTKKKKNEQSVPVRGLKESLTVSIAEETGAVPGERIVGIMNPGKGVTIYPIFSNALRQFETQPELWVDLTWDVEAQSKRLFPARIAIVIANQVGALAQVTAIVSDNHANIENLLMITRAEDFYEIQITIEVRDIQHLNAIMEQFQNCPSIYKVARMNG